MKTLFLKINAVFISALLLLGHPVFAAAPDEIASYETIASQLVVGDNAVAPYFITGENIVGMLQGLVGFETPGSSIVFNRKTGQLFVRNTPTNQLVIENVLDSLRESVKRQVHIEARIIKVTSDDFKGVGINTGTYNIGNDADSTTGSAPAIGSGTVDGVAFSSEATQTLFRDINTILTSSQLGGAFQVGLAKPGRFDFDVVIDALSRVAEVNTLANPNLSTFNNQRANISIATHEFYIREIDSSFTTGTASTSQLTVAKDPTVDIARSGTVLDVTPTINANGSITLELRPQFVTVDLTNTQAISVGSGVNDSVTLPAYSSQEINTTVTIENGGVVVLGGLIHEEETRQADKVPVLGSIPLAGKLFQSKTKRNQKTHLLIFVKARVK